MPRYIVGELIPRGRRQDHEVGILPFGEAAQNRVEKASVGSRYRMPVWERENSIVSTDRTLSQNDYYRQNKGTKGKCSVYSSENLKNVFG
jgi:hypothetical protein